MIQTPTRRSIHQRRAWKALASPVITLQRIPKSTLLFITIKHWPADFQSAPASCFKRRSRKYWSQAVPSVRRKEMTPLESDIDQWRSLLSVSILNLRNKSLQNQSSVHLSTEEEDSQTQGHQDCRGRASAGRSQGSKTQARALVGEVGHQAAAAKLSPPGVQTIDQ